MVILAACWLLHAHAELGAGAVLLLVVANVVDYVGLRAIIRR